MAQIFTGWNPLMGWLWRIEHLRRASPFSLASDHAPERERQARKRYILQRRHGRHARLASRRVRAAAQLSGDPDAAFRSAVALADGLFPHQIEGVAFLLGRRRAILADDMGLGKTRQAIVSLRHARARRTPYSSSARPR